MRLPPAPRAPSSSSPNCCHGAPLPRPSPSSHRPPQLPQTRLLRLGSHGSLPQLKYTPPKSPELPLNWVGYKIRTPQPGVWLPANRGYNYGRVCFPSEHCTTKHGPSLRCQRCGGPPSASMPRTGNLEQATEPL